MAAKRRRRSSSSSGKARLPIVIVLLFAIVGAAAALLSGVDLLSLAGVREQPPGQQQPGGQGHPAMALLASLTVTEVDPSIPPYDRDDWRHWVDEDRDCQNARHEVLIAESMVPVTFTDDRQCSVAAGRWLDPYTGQVVTEASALDIDHMVPLANAHRSGGWAWDAERRQAFANYLLYDDHLIAVTASANRAKGDKGPEEWRPPLQDYWCEYAEDWVTIKAEWGLSVTPAERDALEEMLATC